MKPNIGLLVTAITAFLYASAASAHDQVEKLGQVHFPVPCGQEAQTQFDRAVALLQAFWYAQAVTGFTTVDTDLKIGGLGRPGDRMLLTRDGIA